MESMQEKLYAQLRPGPVACRTCPYPPACRIATCRPTWAHPAFDHLDPVLTKLGDQGQCQSSARSLSTLNPPVTCTNTTIATPQGAPDSNHTFISDADMMPNYSDPDISKVLQCISLLGGTGCGFEHQLASIDRALGADGQGPAPSTNANFLRPEALLAIVLLTNEDDCSAPPGTKLYSLNGDQQNIANPLGPIANYRCNQFGHLCTDPTTGAVNAPPLVPPSDAQGTSTKKTLDLTNCTSNDPGSGLLTPVAQFISDIKALKTDPDNQIVVAAIAAPASPYTVAWVPQSGGQNTQPGELWPQIEHSCGASAGSDVNPAGQLVTDGSFGDPGVRIATFVNAFSYGYLESVCDASYLPALSAVTARIGQLIGPP